MARFIRRRLARSTDPITSKIAAEMVDLTLRNKHVRLLMWLRANAPATDDQMAIAAVDMGLCARHEQGRRLARTMRENYGLIVPYCLENGEQMETVNTSGRPALCWRAS